MAKRCKCPPVASRGIFKYLTYLIPVKECHHRYYCEGAHDYCRWLLNKVKLAFSTILYYLSKIPFHSIVDLLELIQNYVRSDLLDAFLGKWNMFLSIMRPVLDKFLAFLIYIWEWITWKRKESNEESDVKGESYVDKREVVCPKSEIPRITPDRIPTIEVRINEVKVEKCLEKTPSEAKSFSRFNQQSRIPKESCSKNIKTSEIDSIMGEVEEEILEPSPSTERFYTRIFRAFKMAANRSLEFFKNTGRKIGYGGSCAYNYMASCPLWVYAYILFILMMVGYLAVETYITYTGKLWAKKNKVPEQIREGCKDFILSDATLKEIMKKLRCEVDKGLNPSTKGASSVKCFTTYVQDLPTGKETGRFLALDLGGTNFRVLLITLNGRHFDMQSKIYVIPQDLMVGNSENLFKHIAQCLAEFTKEHKVNAESLPLGFTFSFPLEQRGLTVGILQRWTKGFNCPDAVGQDVVQLLKKAIDARGDVKIDIMAVLNDTTGTLMSCAWKNNNCKIGVILGTGTNACYVEKIENVIGFDGDKGKPVVLINTEWGAFGDNGELAFITTPYDKEVDAKSINPGKQLHEKFISGMYLGEIVRLLLVKFTKDKLIFGGKLTSTLETENSFPTEFLSEIESDKRGVFKNCRKTLAKVGYDNVSDEDCNSVRYICECVSRRAAHLASAGLATLMNKMGYPSLTIGVDGSLYRFHPHFHDLMIEKISLLIEEKIVEFGLMLSTDGSGRGAALVAASAAASGK